MRVFPTNKKKNIMILKSTKKKKIIEGLNLYNKTGYKAMYSRNLAVLKSPIRS